MPHLVHVFQESGEIATSAAAFLAEGLAGGEPAIVIASDAHRELINASLGKLGWDSRKLEAQGLLVQKDAGDLLAAIHVGEALSPDRFEKVVGSLVARASERAGGLAPRAYGEMVDILWQRGEAAAAVALEALWNELARTCEFSLLCGYRVDIFDRAAQAAFLPHVCRAHSEFVPGENAPRVEAAVDAALTETLGRRDTERVYALVAGQAREGKVPPAQLALMWVSSNMPRTAERIMALARARYTRHAPA